jgi:hypothetical protein
MEVHFTPYQEAQLTQIAASAGTDTGHLVKGAALRLLAGNADTPKEAPSMRAMRREGLTGFSPMTGIFSRKVAGPCSKERHFAQTERRDIGARHVAKRYDERRVFTWQQLSTGHNVRQWKAFLASVAAHGCLKVPACPWPPSLRTFRI